MQPKELIFISWCPHMVLKEAMMVCFNANGTENLQYFIFPWFIWIQEAEAKRYVKRYTYYILRPTVLLESTSDTWKGVRIVYMSRELRSFVLRLSFHTVLSFVGSIGHNDRSGFQDANLCQSYAVRKSEWKTIGWPFLVNASLNAIW